MRKQDSKALGDITNRRNQRMAENEVVFRSYNERVQKGFDTLNDIADKDGQSKHISDPSTVLHFLCECSDENCLQRVILLPNLYNSIHTLRNRFVIVCGHEVISLERIVETHPGFCVVEKFITPSETVTTLKATTVDNT